MQKLISAKIMNKFSNNAVAFLFIKTKEVIQESKRSILPQQSCRFVFKESRPKENPLSTDNKRPNLISWHKNTSILAQMTLYSALALSYLKLFHTEKPHFLFQSRNKLKIFN